MKKINQSGILLKYCPCLVALALVCPGLSIVAMNDLNGSQNGEINKRIELNKSNINNEDNTIINLQLEGPQIEGNLSDYKNSFMEHDKENNELEKEIKNNMAEEEKVTTILRENPGFEEGKGKKDDDETEKNNDLNENNNVENLKMEENDDEVVELKEQKKGDEEYGEEKEVDESKIKESQEYKGNKIKRINGQDKEAGDSNSENELNIKESIRSNSQYEDDILNDKVDLDKDKFYGEDAEKMIKGNITAVCGGLDNCAKLMDIPYSGTKTASDMENDPLFRWIARMIDENRMQNINNPDDKIRDTAYGSNPRFYDFEKSGVGLYWDFVGEKYKPQPGQRCYVNDYRAIAGMVTDAINLYYFICRKWGYDAVKNAFTNEITVKTTDCTLEEALAGSIRKDIHRYFRTYLGQDSNDSHILGLYCFYSIVQDVFGTGRKIDFADDDERNESDEVNDRISDEEDDIEGGAIRKSQADNYIEFLKKNCNLQKVIKCGTSMVDDILKARHDPERRRERGSVINTSGGIWYPFERIDKSIAQKQALIKEYITGTDGWCDDLRGSVNRYWRSIFNEIRRKFKKDNSLSYEYNQGERLYDLMRKKRCYLPLLGIFFVDDAVYGNNCVYTWLDVAWRAKHWNERLAVRKQLQREYFKQSRRKYNWEKEPNEYEIEDMFEIDSSDSDDETIKTKLARNKEVDEQVDKKVGSINKIEEMIFNGDGSESLCDMLNEIMDSILGGVPLGCLYRAMGTDDKGNTVVNCSNPYGSTDLRNGESLLCVEFCQSYDDKKYPLRFRNGNGSMKNMVGLHGETLLSSEEMLSINEGERILAACVPVDLADGVFGGKTEKDGLSVAESVAKKVSGTVRLLTAVGDHLKCEDIIVNKGANVWFAKSYDLMGEDYCGDSDFVKAVCDMLVSKYETGLYNQEVDLYNQGVKIRRESRERKHGVVGREYDRNKFVGAWAKKVDDYLWKEKGPNMWDARRGDEVHELAKKLGDCEYVKGIMIKIADEPKELMNEIHDLRKEVDDKAEEQRKQQMELKEREIKISNLQKELLEKNKLIERNKRKVNKYELNRIGEMDDDGIDTEDLNMTMNIGSGNRLRNERFLASKKEALKSMRSYRDYNSKILEMQQYINKIYDPESMDKKEGELTYEKIKFGGFNTYIKKVMSSNVVSGNRFYIKGHPGCFRDKFTKAESSKYKGWGMYAEYAKIRNEIFEKVLNSFGDRSAEDLCKGIGLELRIGTMVEKKGGDAYNMVKIEPGKNETFKELIERWRNKSNGENETRGFTIK